MQVAQDPKLWQIAARYLDAQPTCAGAGAWWSFAGESPLEERLATAQELFHYDPIDYRRSSSSPTSRTSTRRPVLTWSPVAATSGGGSATG